MGQARMTKKPMTFGQLLRETRLAQGFSLRRFAILSEVSATYISQVEQDNVDPPTAERVAKMAELLGQNPDEWILMANRMPEDLPGIIERQPVKIPALLREASGLTAEQLQKLTETARKLKENVNKKGRNK